MQALQLQSGSAPCCRLTRPIGYLVTIFSVLLMIGTASGQSRIRFAVSAAGSPTVKSLASVQPATSTTATGQTLPTLSVDDFTLAEGDPGLITAAEFKISMSAASTQTVTFTASTQAGTATPNVDYASGSINLQFDPGQTSVVLSVLLIVDTTVEDDETFFLNLSNPVNATIADGQAQATIIDDDSLILLTEQNVQRALALDSVLFTRDSFSIANNLNFSSDHVTRIAVFATGVKLAQNEDASAVTATAEDSQGTVRPLTVEFVGKVPNFTWMNQVVLKLNDQITLTGDVKIKIALHGAMSNEVLVGLKSP